MAFIDETLNSIEHNKPRSVCCTAG